MSAQTRPIRFQTGSSVVVTLRRAFPVTTLPKLTDCASNNRETIPFSVHQTAFEPVSGLCEPTRCGDVTNAIRLLSGLGAGRFQAEEPHAPHRNHKSGDASE